MFCDEVLEAIEPVAAGDLPLDDRLAAHVDSCAHCRAALDRAREIERLLSARPAPAAPPHFTSRTLAQIRLEWWQSEQVVDTAFNIGMAILFTTAVAAVWVLLRSAGLPFGDASRDVFAFVWSGLISVARRAAAVAPFYTAATLLLAAAMAAWWWAERDPTA
jgi:hypothetical protein